MREVLSRAKRVEDNQWVEGNYVKYQKRMVCPIGDSLKDEDVEHFMFFESFADWNMPRELMYTKIKPETLGQYTGKLDVEGKRIFEGDMLELYPYSERWIVYWDEKELMYKIYSREGGDMPLSAIKNPTVVGNLWDKMV